MRIAVTGATGGLGRAFLDTCSPHHDVHAFSHGDLDVGSYAEVMQRLVPMAAELIVNCAAFTAVDLCESDPVRAYRDNALGAQNLALAARACGAVLVHVSTDYVFDGTKARPYDELDDPNPMNAYGRSKLAGESFARSLAPETFIVRTGFVFGGGRDFLTGALHRLIGGESVGGIADRTGTPTYVRHLAERLLPLALTGRFGTYHIAGPEPTTWFDLLSRAKAVGGLSGRVAPQEAKDLRQSALRPRNSALTSVFSSHVGIEPMPSLDVAIGDLLSRVQSG